MLIRIPRLPHRLPGAVCLRLPITQSIRCYANIDKSNPTRKTKFSALDDEMKALHLFIKNLTPAQLPKDLCKVTFSRSSGPGGQNVNKLNTKATIRLNVYEVEEKLNWPHILVDALREHRDTTTTGEIVVSSQRYRTQTQNLEDAWAKMFTFVKNIVELPGYTTLDASDRVEKLKKKDKERVRAWKTEHSLKKQARKGNYPGNELNW